MGETLPTPPVQVSPAEKPKGKSDEPWLVNAVFVIIIHICALATICLYSSKPSIYWLAYACWHLGTLGITMGYHRLWSHRTYDAHPLYRLTMAILGTMAFQGSIKWWALRHRLHHRYTDTDHDPYNAKKGLWFSHIGWIFEKPFYPRMKLVDQSDLNADPIVVFQHKYFPQLAFTSAFIVPTIIGYFLGDALGAFLYCGFVTRVVTWHVTFSINSFAHYNGEQLYSTETSARGNFILAVLTNGEGYHNFHHEFPKDYRNGVETFDYDPSKWLIKLASLFGLTWNLKKVDKMEIEKAKIQVMESKIQTGKKELNWGPDVTTLPTISLEEFSTRASEVAKKGGCLVTLDGYVLDVSKFLPEHPGGEQLLLSYSGKDITKAFYGILNNHSKSARTLVLMFRNAKISDSQKDE
ncbi:hypothetical protein HK096_005618 [Nowakowskiella sp. JEL0078]|nr:hypothetical protein HK096_005618 [Nowakowskiella sp. JEL0078]